MSALDRAKELLDPSRFDLSQYPAHSFAKYFDLETWIPINERRARAIGLHRGPPRRVLDIGTGCGYFPFVCAGYSHEVVALDAVKRRRVYRDVTAALGVPVLDYDVRPFEPLPDLGTFDVIAAFMVTFNGHGETPWGANEWRFFITDMRARLRPGGAIVLELNEEPPPLSACYTPELRAVFLDMGAETGRVRPHRIVFR